MMNAKMAEDTALKRENRCAKMATKIPLKEPENSDESTKDMALTEAKKTAKG